MPESVKEPQARTEPDIESVRGDAMAEGAKRALEDEKKRRGDIRALFANHPDHDKVRELDRRVTRAMGASRAGVLGLPGVDELGRVDLPGVKVGLEELCPLRRDGHEEPWITQRPAHEGAHRRALEGRRSGACESGSENTKADERKSRVDEVSDITASFISN